MSDFYFIFRATENEGTDSVKRKGIKRKGISDNEVCSTKDLNGLPGISYSVQQSPSQSINANCSDLVNNSALSSQNVSYLSFLFTYLYV